MRLLPRKYTRPRPAPQSAGNPVEESATAVGLLSESNGHRKGSLSNTYSDGLSALFLSVFFTPIGLFHTFSYFFHSLAILGGVCYVVSIGSSQ